MYDRRQSWWLTTGGVSGIAVPVLCFTLIILSILSYPQFSLTNNALSDLGVVPGITATFFNFGLYAGGLMSLWFTIGLYKFLNRNAVGKAGALVFVVASLGLEGIGIAPEGTNAFNFPWHYFFSVLFFTAVPIALLVIMAYFLTAKEKREAAFTLLIAIIAAAPWATYFAVQYVPNVAIPELISALAASAWSVKTGWEMYHAASKLEIALSRPKNPPPKLSLS